MVSCNLYISLTLYIRNSDYKFMYLQNSVLENYTIGIVELSCQNRSMCCLDLNETCYEFLMQRRGGQRNRKRLLELIAHAQVHT